MAPTRRAALAALAGTTLLAGCALPIGEADFLRPARATWPHADAVAATRRTVEVRQADGNVSRGIHQQVPGARITVLLFLGNDQTVDLEGSVRLWQYTRMPADLWVFDRRGHGQTPGRADAASLLADARTLFDHVRERSRGPLVVHGFSLGTAEAAAVARDRRPDAVVMEGAVSSVQEYVEAHLPWYVKPFARVRVDKVLADTDPRAALAAYRGPLLIAVGEKDPDTLPELSRRLHDSLDNPAKRLAVIPGAHHHALITPAGHEVLRGFLAGLAT